MVEIPTVLILGAGASAHLGYPVGSALKEQVCTVLTGDGGGLAPLIASSWTVEHRNDLAKRLGNSGYDSVDAFLESNEDCMELGKATMVYMLQRHESVGRLLWPAAVGWYADLFRGIQTTDPEDFTKNKIAVVTFNYDRSLEVFLTQRVRYHYNLAEDQAVRLVGELDVVHPHGVMGAYPGIPYSSEDGDDLARRVASIKVIGELQDRADSFCSPEFEAAHDFLREAKRIYFLGFGFHDDNIRRFRFFNTTALHNKDVHSTLQKPPRAQWQEFHTRLATNYGLRSEIFSKGRDCDCNHFFREVARLA